MDNIRKTSTDLLEPGMILGKDLDSSIGNILLKKGYIFDQTMIDKLCALHIEYVYTLETSKEQSFTLGRFTDFDETAYIDYYNELINVMSQIDHDVRLGKTLRISTVRTIINNLLKQIFSKNNILYCLTLVKHFDEYTYTHCINVCLLATTLGKWLHLSNKDLMQLAYSALFHDLGKYKIPHEILNKPGKLTSEEFELIKKHPIYGYEIVSDIIGVGPHVAYGVLMHHEREDGTGYPLGLKGDQIHLFGKIISVADIYDALTSDRSYHKKISPFNAADIITRKAFSNIEPEIASTFLNNISKFYIGCMVHLSTDQTGKIIYLYPNKPTRPLIELENGEYIDLSKDENSNIFIDDILPS